MRSLIGSSSAPSSILSRELNIDAQATMQIRHDAVRGVPERRRARRTRRLGRRADVPMAEAAGRRGSCRSRCGCGHRVSPIARKHTRPRADRPVGRRHGARGSGDPRCQPLPRPRDAARDWRVRAISWGSGKASCRFGAERPASRSCRRGTTTPRCSKGFPRSPASRSRSRFRSGCPERDASARLNAPPIAAGRHRQPPGLA